MKDTISRKNVCSVVDRESRDGCLVKRLYFSVPSVLSKPCSSLHRFQNDYQELPGLPELWPCRTGRARQKRDFIPQWVLSVSRFHLSQYSPISTYKNESMPKTHAMMKDYMKWKWWVWVWCIRKHQTRVLVMC